MDKTVPPGRVKGTLTPPCSKSYAQRALAASLLCGETSVLRNLEFCDDTRSALRTLTEAESTYLDVFPDSLIGSFAVPDKKDLMGETLKFAFYLNKTNLIFIDEGQVCTRLLDDIERIGVLKEPTAAHCLFEFM